MKKISIVLFCLLATFQSTFSAETDNLMLECCVDGSTFESKFKRGAWEVGINSGVIFSPVLVTVQEHTYNYTTTGIQAGYMLTTPGNPGWYRGNLEVVAELFGGGVFGGRGSYVAGGTIWFRYNFVQPGWRVIPFAQLGGGGETTDIDRRIQAGDENFNVDASLGLRYMINAHLSLNSEWRFQHFSNAGTSLPNRGTNGQGLVLGVSWLF